LEAGATGIAAARAEIDRKFGIAIAWRNPHRAAQRTNVCGGPRRCKGKAEGMSAAFADRPVVEETLTEWDGVSRPPRRAAATRWIEIPFAGNMSRTSIPLIAIRGTRRLPLEEGGGRRWQLRVQQSQVTASGAVGRERRAEHAAKRS